ncbi:MAG: DNA mismatch repair protein MutL, partial [Paramuribaculum sp.]|nr:DNA mismatch repair protein MutL [Paramuribaculum sp.]
IESSACPYINIKGKYIVSAAKSGIMIVDRHRAHLRVLYDKFLDLYSRKAFSSQQVLFPEVIELNPSMSQVMRSIADELAIMGFEISFLGGNSWTINGIPSVISDSNPRSLLLNILENTADNNPHPTSLPLAHKVALAMAEAAAVTASQPVTPEEMTGLMSDLLKLSSPDFTPDGRPVITIITTDEIASRLK